MGEDVLDPVAGDYHVVHWIHIALRQKVRTIENCITDRVALPLPKAFLW